MVIPTAHENHNVISLKKLSCFDNDCHFEKNLKALDEDLKSDVYFSINVKEEGDEAKKRRKETFKLIATGFTDSTAGENEVEKEYEDNLLLDEKTGTKSSRNSKESFITDEKKGMKTTKEVAKEGEEEQRNDSLEKSLNKQVDKLKTLLTSLDEIGNTWTQKIQTKTNTKNDPLMKDVNDDFVEEFDKGMPEDQKEQTESTEVRVYGDDIVFYEPIIDTDRNGQQKSTKISMWFVNMMNLTTFDLLCSLKDGATKGTKGLLYLAIILFVIPGFQGQLPSEGVLNVLPELPIRIGEDVHISCTCMSNYCTGTSKWTGGPKNEIITFGKETYDKNVYLLNNGNYTLVLNSSTWMYVNSTYTCHIGSAHKTVVLTEYGYEVQPVNETFMINTSFDENTKLVNGSIVFQKVWPLPNCTFSSDIEVLKSTLMSQRKEFYYEVEFKFNVKVNESRHLLITCQIGSLTHNYTRNWPRKRNKHESNSLAPVIIAVIVVVVIAVPVGIAIYCFCIKNGDYKAASDRPNNSTGQH